jgi:hypothetical protein
MGMKLLAFHNQLITNLTTHDEDDNFISFHILQDAQVSCPQFELGQWIRPQLLDRLRGIRRQVLEAGQNGSFKDPLLTRGQ